MSEQKYFIFDWKKHQTQGIDIPTLDNWFNSVAKNASGGYLEKIIGFLMLIVGAAYILGRKSLVEEQERIARQDFEAAIHDSHHTQVNI
jgi:hypothetical protein